MAFREIIGQEQPIKILRHAYEHKSLAHAYLFVGPKGIGKFTTAVEFAKAICCQNKKLELTACDLCTSCKKVINRNHPDVQIVHPIIKKDEEEYAEEGRYIEIEQLRELIHQANFKPLEGDYKIFIIDDAHLMTADAQNAALKTLEEPPLFLIWILCTPNPQALLLTVQSRCQWIRFQIVPQRLLAQTLEDRFGLTSADSQLIAKLAGGRIGLAIRLAKDDSWLRLRDKIVSWVSQLHLQKPIKVFKLAEELTEIAYSYLEVYKGLEVSGEQATQPQQQLLRIALLEIFDLIYLWYRDLLIWKNTKEKSLLVNQDLQVFLKDCEQAYPVAKILIILETLRAVRLQIYRNAMLEPALTNLILAIIG